MCGVQVHVDFRSAQVLVPEHVLYRTQVGTPLKEVGGKTVTERMRRNLFGYSGFGGIVPDENKERYARQGLASGARNKDVVFVAAPYVYVLADLEPVVQFPDGPW